MKISKLGDKEYTREEAEAIKAEIERQLAEPKYRFWEGQYVEVRDGNGRWITPRKFFYVSNVGKYVVSDSLGFTLSREQCRPLQDPNVLQFKPHDGRDGCPCPFDTPVVVKPEDGSIIHYNQAQNVWWHEVVAWCPAEGWGVKWWEDEG